MNITINVDEREVLGEIGTDTVAEWLFEGIGVEEYFIDYIERNYRKTYFNNIVFIKKLLKQV